MPWVMGTEEDMVKCQSLLLLFLLEERSAVGMTTPPYLPRGEWEIYTWACREGQSPWLPSLPSRRGMGGGHDHTLPFLKL